MCTRVFWNRNGVAAVCGRTLDWETSDDPRLWVIPRGTKRSGGTDPGAVNWATYYLSHLPAPADAAEAVAAVFGVVRNCQVPYGAPDSRFDTYPTWWDLVPAVLDRASAEASPRLPVASARAPDDHDDAPSRDGPGLPAAQAS